jgi:hypothetical protein
LKIFQTTASKKIVFRGAIKSLKNTKLHEKHKTIIRNTSLLTARFNEAEIPAGPGSFSLDRHAVIGSPIIE